MPIMIHGGGGATEVQYAELTKTMLSLDGEYLVITFPSDVPVTSIVAFGVKVSFESSDLDIALYYHGGAKRLGGLGRFLGSSSRGVNISQNAVVDETKNSIKTSTGGWDERWTGAQSDLKINSEDTESCFYCYT